MIISIMRSPFIASFAFVLQRCKRRGLRAKPIPLWMSATKGSPSGRAPAIAGERVIVAIIRPLRRLRRHLSPRERLFVSPIISQIGRENNISAENYVSRTVEDAGPYNLVNILMIRSVKGRLFYLYKKSILTFSRWKALAIR